MRNVFLSFSRISPSEHEGLNERLLLGQLCCKSLIVCISFRQISHWSLSESWVKLTKGQLLSENGDELPLFEDSGHVRWSSEISWSAYIICYHQSACISLLNILFVDVTKMPPVIWLVTQWKPAASKLVWASAHK